MITSNHPTDPFKSLLEKKIPLINTNMLPKARNINGNSWKIQGFSKTHKHEDLDDWVQPQVIWNPQWVLKDPGELVY